MELGPVARGWSGVVAVVVGDEVFGFFGSLRCEVVDRFVQGDWFAAEVAQGFEGGAAAGLVHSNVHGFGPRVLLTFRIISDIATKMRRRSSVAQMKISYSESWFRLRRRLVWCVPPMYAMIATIR